MKTADNDREYVEGQYEANLPRDLIEYLMLEIDCLPTYYWGATARHMWYCGYFAHGENPGCCWGYMHSMEVS